MFRPAIGAFLPCAGGCGALVRSCSHSAPVGVGLCAAVGLAGGLVCWLLPLLWEWWGFLGGLLLFVPSVWLRWHLLQRLPFGGSSH